MFKNLGNMASLLNQARQMGGKMQEVQEKLKSQRAVGWAGGGMVEVEVNGLGEVLRMSIDPTLLEKGDAEMIEDLAPAAFNQAQAKAKQLHVDAMRDITDGINLPGLEQALSQITGAPES